MNIREMIPEDVEQVAQIERENFSQPWSPQAFTEALRLPHIIFLVARETVANSCGDIAEMILGYVCMYVALDEGEITNVAVGRFFQKQGVGERLLRTLKEEAAKSGIRRIVLEVRRSNEPAIRLYEKMGFQKLGIRKGFYEMPKEDAIVMAWEIE